MTPPEPTNQPCGGWTWQRPGHVLRTKTAAARCAAASCEGWQPPRGVAPFWTGAWKKRVTWRAGIHRFFINKAIPNLHGEGRFHHIYIYFNSSTDRIFVVFFFERVRMSMVYMDGSMVDRCRTGNHGRWPWEMVPVMLGATYPLPPLGLIGPFLTWFYFVTNIWVWVKIRYPKIVDG